MAFPINIFRLMFLVKCYNSMFTMSLHDVMKWRRRRRRRRGEGRGRGGREEKILMADIEVLTCRSTITTLLTMCMLHVHICCVFDRLYVSERVEVTLHYRYKPLDQKPRPQSQSYIGPTSVGPSGPKIPEHTTSLLNDLQMSTEPPLLT